MPLLLAFVLASRVASSDTAELGELLARCRAAHGSAKFAASGKELLAEGEATDQGLAGPWRMRLAPDGRYASEHASRFPSRDGFDGAATWHLDAARLATRTRMEEREAALLDHALWSGAWCAEQGPVVVTEQAADGALHLRMRDGLLEGELTLGSERPLPARLVLRGFRGERSFAFDGWHEVDGGAWLPTSCVVDDEGQQSRFVIARVALAPPDPAAFAFPATRPADTTFDAATPPALACKAARSGHLLVHAELDGADRGAWIFDSGAGGMVIDPDLAQELGYEEFGELWIGGAGAARTTTHWYEGKSLRVGPATMSKPRLSGLELDGLSQSFGQKLVGIVGYDFLQRVVAVVDMAKARVEIHDPATFRRDDAVWRPLLLHGRHPHVECTFGVPDEESALFRLDTGAPGVTVLFHSPFVRDHELLAGRVTAAFDGLGGVGGQSKARIGPLDWFELGGVVTDRPTVIFVEDALGGLADPWSAGTIGGQLLEKSLLIFDYPHDRVGFAPRD